MLQLWLAPWPLACLISSFLPICRLDRVTHAEIQKSGNPSCKSTIFCWKSEKPSKIHPDFLWQALTVAVGGIAYFGRISRNQYLQALSKPTYESHNNKNFNRVGDQSFEQGRWFVNMSLNRIRNYRFELWIAMVRTSFRRFSSWISVMVSRISATNCKSLNFD